jgi:hypothetical protein
MASADQGRLAIASGGRRDLYAAARRGVQVFVYGSVADLRAAASFGAESLKYPEVDPISGNFRALATHTIHSRHQSETYATVRKSFSPIDHMWFTKSVIFRAAS